MRTLIFILSFLCCLGGNAYAQSKPKRNISKDRSAIAAKQAQKKTTSKTKKKKSKKETVQQPRSQGYSNYNSTPSAASYLTVNGATSLSYILKAREEAYWFSVETDGRSWEIVDLPYWCNATKYSDSFLLKCDANPSHYLEREGTIIVRSDAKEVRIFVRQLVIPLDLKANISDVYFRHNVPAYYQGRETKCLEVNAYVTISGAANKNRTCDVNVYLEDANKNVDVYYAKLERYAPWSDEAVTYRLVGYIPNEQMKFSDIRCRIRCIIATFDADTGETTNVTYFSAEKSKRGVVTTGPDKQ